MRLFQNTFCNPAIAAEGKRGNKFRDFSHAACDRIGDLPGRERRGSSTVRSTLGQGGDVRKACFAIRGEGHRSDGAAAKRLVKCQGHRHYWFQRYLTICMAGPNGDFPRLRLEFVVSPLARIGRVIGRVMHGEFNRGLRVDKYHNMNLYRAKLRAFAKKRQQQHKTVHRKTITSPDPLQPGA